jgi:hypothetical protein
MYYAGIHLEVLREITKNFSQHSRSQGPRFETGTFQIRSRSVNHSTASFGGKSVELSEEDSYHTLLKKQIEVQSQAIFYEQG